MRSNLVKLFIVTIVALYSASALAIFDGGLLVGKRWFEDEDGDGVAAQETTVSFHVDPIPVVPVAFGAAYSLYSFNEADFGSTVDSATGNELGVEVVGWLPMVPFVTPYAKFRYVVQGEIEVKYTFEGVSGTTKSKLSGFHLNAGIEYSLIPMVAIQLEIGQASEQAKSDGADASDFNSQCVLIGGKFGL